jgi:hypothetical protein
LLSGRLFKRRGKIKAKSTATQSLGRGCVGEQARGDFLRLGEKSRASHNRRASLPASPFDMLRASCFTKGRGSGVQGGGDAEILVEGRLT